MAEQSGPIVFTRNKFRCKLVTQPYAELAAAGDATHADLIAALQAMPSEDIEVILLHLVEHTVETVALTAAQSRIAELEQRLARVADLSHDRDDDTHEKRSTRLGKCSRISWIASEEAASLRVLKWAPLATQLSEAEDKLAVAETKRDDLGHALEMERHYHEETRGYRQHAEQLAEAAKNELGDAIIHHERILRDIRLAAKGEPVEVDYDSGALQLVQELKAENSQHCLDFQAIASALGILDELPEMPAVLERIAEQRTELADWKRQYEERDEEIRSLDDVLEKECGIDAGSGIDVGIRKLREQVAEARSESAASLAANRSLNSALEWAKRELGTHERIVHEFGAWLGEQAEFFQHNPQVNRTFLDVAARLMEALREVRPEAQRIVGPVDPLSVPVGRCRCVRWNYSAPHEPGCALATPVPQHTCTATTTTFDGRPPPPCPACLADPEKFGIIGHTSIVPLPINPMATEGNFTISLSEYHVVNLRELIKCCGFDGTGGAATRAVFAYNTGDWLGELWLKLEKFGLCALKPNKTLEQVTNEAEPVFTRDELGLDEPAKVIPGLAKMLREKQTSEPATKCKYCNRAGCESERYRGDPRLLRMCRHAVQLERDFLSNRVGRLEAGLKEAERNRQELLTGLEKIRDAIPSGGTISHYPAEILELRTERDEAQRDNAVTHDALELLAEQYDRALSQFDAWLGEQASAFARNIDVNRAFHQAKAKLLETMQAVKGEQAPIDEVTEGFPPFGCDPGDSAALLKLREAIDAADMWPSAFAKESGDYEAAVLFMARNHEASERLGALLDVSEKHAVDEIEHLRSECAKVERLWKEATVERDGLIDFARRNYRRIFDALYDAKCSSLPDKLTIAGDMKRLLEWRAQPNAQDTSNPTTDGAHERGDASPQRVQQAELPAQGEGCPGALSQLPDSGDQAADVRGAASGQAAGARLEHLTFREAIEKFLACGEPLDVTVSPLVTPSGCWCHKCNPDQAVFDTRMILCPTCGNKRCPKASDHDLGCSGSNEPGQVGSWHTKPAPPPCDKCGAIDGQCAARGCLTMAERVEPAPASKQDSGQHQGISDVDKPSPAPSASIGGEATPSNPTGTTAGNVTKPYDDPDRNRVVGPGAGRATSKCGWLQYTLGETFACVLNHEHDGCRQYDCTEVARKLANKPINKSPFRIETAVTMAPEANNRTIAEEVIQQAAERDAEVNPLTGWRKNPSPLDGNAECRHMWIFRDGSCADCDAPGIMVDLDAVPATTPRPQAHLTTREAVDNFIDSGLAAKRVATEKLGEGAVPEVGAMAGDMGKAETVTCSFCVGTWPVRKGGAIAMIRGLKGTICQNCVWRAGEIVAEHLAKPTAPVHPQPDPTANAAKPPGVDEPDYVTRKELAALLREASTADSFSPATTRQLVYAAERLERSK